VTTPTGPERILAGFSDLSADAREVVGETLERQYPPFLSALGSSLCHSPKLAQMVLKCALKRVSWDGSATLVRRLGDNEPWGTVKQVLIEALEAVPPALVGDEIDP
jgi:hypothetical protein